MVNGAPSKTPRPRAAATKGTHGVKRGSETPRHFIAPAYGGNKTRRRRQAQFQRSESFARLDRAHNEQSRWIVNRARIVTGALFGAAAWDATRDHRHRTSEDPARFRVFRESTRHDGLVLEFL